MEWQAIDSAPFDTTVRVRNLVIREQGDDVYVLARRGYSHNGKRHPNDRIFTSVYTVGGSGGPFPGGRPVFPDQWMPDEEPTA